MKLSSLQTLLSESQNLPVYLYSISSSKYYSVVSIESYGILELFAGMSQSTMNASELYSKILRLNPELKLHATIDYSAFPVRALKATSNFIILEF